MDCRNIIVSVLVLLSSWLLFVGRDHPRLLLGRAQRATAPAAASSVLQVGALLDLGSTGGRESRASMSLALDDFYASRPPDGSGTSTTVALHVADCKDDEITAASAAIDLLKDFKMQAIIGPKTSMQARFIIGIGNMTNVPILSYSATSPYLSAKQSRYFIRTALDDASQVPAIASLIEYFSWRQAINVELNKLKTMQTRVFVVHMSFDVVARLFALAHDAEMLVDGYAWIVTDSVGNMCSTLDGNTIHAMQNVLGVRPYIPWLDKLLNFCARFLSRAGFWTPKFGLSKKLVTSSGRSDTVGLNTLIWPGGSAQAPRGWEWPVAGKKLKIVVPVKPAPNAFVNVKKNPATGKFDVTVYCIDVFEAVMQEMPYAVPYEYVPIVDHQPIRLKYDAMVGDTTITINRSLYVDFTLPYTESGVQMIVPMKKNWSMSLWVFLKPIEPILWAAFLVVLVFTGFVIWLVEHKESRDFGGSAWRQLVNIAYFSFQALLAVPKGGRFWFPMAGKAVRRGLEATEPTGEPILEPTDEPIHNPILAPPHLVGSAAGVSTLPDLPSGRSSSQDLRHYRRLGPSRRGSMSSPCGSMSLEQGVDAAALDPPSCGSTSQGVDAAAWIHRRVDHPSLRATQLLAY
ncbi:glutamate receptor 2.4-like [Miscanthus floridulus]|uniref:glutamate receptor 2.4-like n=1 Tax=Miscanthus floridulus TaxID=154761 RepID=UPI00345AF305